MICNNAIHDNVAGEISALANVSPADQDYLLIEDFDDSQVEEIIEITLTEEEQQALQKSAEAVQELKNVLKNLT